MYHAKVMVSVSAISPAEVYLLAADRFWKLWQEHGYPPQDLMAHFVRRITMLSDYICCSHFLEDDKRVAYFLHTCCASSGPSIPYTHEQIAAITGMSRVSVTRILKQFREAGILRQSYRRIEILAPQRLSESLPPWDIFWTEPFRKAQKIFPKRGLLFLLIGAKISLRGR